MKIKKKISRFITLTFLIFMSFAACLSKEICEHSKASDCGEYYKKVQEVALAINHYDTALENYHNCSGIESNVEFERIKERLRKQEKILEKVISDNSGLWGTITNPNSSLASVIANSIKEISPIAKGVIHSMESQARKYLIKKCVGTYFGFIILYASAIVILSKLLHVKKHTKTNYGLDDLDKVVGNVEVRQQS